MPTDLEIARSVAPQPIEAIASKLGLKREEILPFGSTKAKVLLQASRLAPMGAMASTSMSPPSRRRRLVKERPRRRSGSWTG